MMHEIEIVLYEFTVDIDVNINTL